MVFQVGETGIHAPPPSGFVHDGRVEIIILKKGDTEDLQEDFHVYLTLENGI